MQEKTSPASDGSSDPSPPLMPWRAQAAIAAAMLAVGLIAFGPGGSLVANTLAMLGLQDDAALGQGGPGAKRNRGGRSAPRVVLADLGEARDDLTLRLTGGAVARRFAELKPRAAGRVTEVLFEGGDFFKTGQPLLRLDDRREKLALERAEASLKEAVRARDRARRLLGTGSGSEAAGDRAETEAVIARITRDEAKEALDDRTVNAPFDGVASLPLVEIGDRVEASTAIASFDDRSSLLVEVAAPEAAYDRLKLGAPVAALTTAYPGEAFKGRIAEIDSRIDRTDRTAKIRLELPNTGDRLRPGMSFTIALDLPGEAALAAPEIALQWERKGAYLWRVVDGVAQQAKVRLLARQDGMALVRNVEAAENPLKPGDKVVIEGVQRLKPGVKVEIVSEENTPSQSGRREGQAGERPARSSRVAADQ